MQPTTFFYFFFVGALTVPNVSISLAEDAARNLATAVRIGNSSEAHLTHFVDNDASNRDSTVACKLKFCSAPDGTAAGQKDVPLKKFKGTVKIGVLHSLTGVMAASETTLKDAVLMAIDEINDAGGVLERRLVPVIADPASNWQLFNSKAQELITVDKVAVTFGCWTSVSRKSTLPVFEEYNALLFFPVQYEGEEQSRNVFYTGPVPNQQLVPAADYMLKRGFKRFYLLGTDYVYPRTADKVLRAFLISKGVPKSCIAEQYVPFHHVDFEDIVGKIKKFSAAGKTCVMSTLNGDSNVPFYKEFAEQGLTPSNCPITAFSLTEEDLRGMDTTPLLGHLAAANYFQSIDTPENKRFVQSYKDYCGKNDLPGGTDRVTDDPIEAAYFGVYVWKAAVEKAKSFDVDKVRKAAYGLEFSAPGGNKKMDAKNQHTWKPVFIGEIIKGGQIKIIHRRDGLARPDSYSKYLHPDGNFTTPTGGPRK